MYDSVGQFTAMKIYTDSSFDEKRNVCGIGLYIEDGAMSYNISNFISATDNNFGEMYAIYLAAIIAHGKDCIIYTDSMTAVAHINNYVKGDKPRSPQEYERYQRLRLMGYKIRQLKPTVVWLKGHRKYFQQNCIGNQLADTLAKQGRAKYYGSHQ